MKEAENKLEEQQKRQRVMNGGAIGGPNSPFTPPGLDFPDRRNPGKDLPKIEKSGVISPFTAAGQAPDWRNPAKDLPFDTLDPVIPSVGDLCARLGKLEGQLLAICSDKYSALHALEHAHEENARLRKEIKRRDEVDSLQFPIVRGVLNAAASWTRGWIAGDSSGVSQDLCQAVLAYWKHMGIEAPREPVDRTQSPDAKRYEVQQKRIAELNQKLYEEIQRRRVAEERLRDIKAIIPDC